MGLGSSEPSRRPSRFGWISRAPSDLVVVSAVGVSSVAGVVLLPEGSPVRVVLGLPLLFFLPGYALLAVLFPERHGGTASIGRTASAWNAVSRRGTITPSERVALSVGVSVALVPILGLALGASPVDLSPETLAVGLAAIVGLGMIHRWRVPEQVRYRSPVGVAVETVGHAVTAPDAVRARALNLAVLFVAVTTLAVLAAAIAAPPQAESYTDLSILTENESGEYVAGGYPTELVRGEATELVIGVENREGERTDYAVVIVLERVGTDGDDLTVREVDEVGRFAFGVDDGRRAYVKHEVTPTMTGEDLRLHYLLYRGDPPDDPSIDTAYRRVFVWVDVTDGG